MWLYLATSIAYSIIHGRHFECADNTVKTTDMIPSINRRGCRGCTVVASVTS